MPTISGSDGLFGYFEHSFKKGLPPKDFKIFREYCWELGGKSLENNHTDRCKLKRPSKLLPMGLLLKEWFIYFSGENTDIIERHIHGFNYIAFSSYKKIPFASLDKTVAYKSINFVADYFAELDLGGNYKWLSLFECVYELMVFKIWNANTKRAVLKEYMEKTRWFIN